MIGAAFLCVTSVRHCCISSSTAYVTRTLKAFRFGRILKHTLRFTGALFQRNEKKKKREKRKEKEGDREQRSRFIWHLDDASLHPEKKKKKKKKKKNARTLCECTRAQRSEREEA